MLDVLCKYVIVHNISLKTFVIIDNYIKVDWTEIEQGFVPKKRL